MRKLTPREAVARVFPSYDLGMADRVISWLDHCGYQIVEKDQVSVLPPDPADAEHRQEPAVQTRGPLRRASAGQKPPVA